MRNRNGDMLKSEWVVCTTSFGPLIKWVVWHPWDERPIGEVMQAIRKMAGQQSIPEPKRSWSVSWCGGSGVATLREIQSDGKCDLPKNWINDVV